MKLTKKKLVEMIETIVESLITEDSVQQVRRNFVDTGKISEADFEEILKTSNKSNNITWLASRVGGTNKIRKIINPEDIYKFKQYFDVFERNKKQYNPSDINKYQTKSEVEDWLHKTIEIKNREQTDVASTKGVTRSDKYAEFYLGNVDGFDVYKIPKGRRDLYKMSCDLGSGTEWCTATGKTPKLFNQYIDSDDLYIFIKGNEKYQFHYDSNSFMDVNDSSVL